MFSGVGTATPFLQVTVKRSLVASTVFGVVATLGVSLGRELPFL